MPPNTPSVRDYMTGAPTTVGTSTTIADAARLMAEQRIRHLPVVGADGRVHGLLSERDVALFEELEGLDASQMTVATAMSKRVYTAEPTTALDEVAAQMAEHKYGSCVVVKQGAVVGVFTTVDACRALAEAFGT